MQINSNKVYTGPRISCLPPSAFAAELTSRRKKQLPWLASKLNHEDEIDYIAVGYYSFKDELASSLWDAELMHSFLASHCISPASNTVFPSKNQVLPVASAIKKSAIFEICANDLD